MNVKCDKTSQKAAKLVQSALETDGRDLYEEAYIKYLESISFIASSLIDSRHRPSSSLHAVHHEPERLTKKQMQKLLSVARQCLDRIEVLTDELEDDENQSAGLLAADANQLTATDKIGSKSTSSPPEMLVSRPLAHLSAARVLPVDRKEPKPETTGSPTSMKLNLKAKQNSILEAINWISPPEESLLEDELNTLKEVVSSSPLEKASRENESLIAAYRARMERATTPSARSNLHLELQRRIAENLDMARQKQETFSADLKRRRQRHLENAALVLRLRGDEVATKKMLHLLDETLGYEQKHRLFAHLRHKLEEIPGSPTDSRIVQTVIRKTLMDCNHPLSKAVSESASGILKQICSHGHLRHVENNNNSSSSSETGMITDEGDSAELEDKDEVVHKKCAACDGGGKSSPLSTSSSLTVSVEELGEDAADFEDIYKRGIFQVESALADGAETMKFLENEKKNAQNSKSVPKWAYSELSLSVSMKRHFHDCVQTINGTLEELIDSFALVYGKLLDNDQARDECRLHIESHFYPPIYPSLMNVYRMICGAAEEKLRQSMQRLADCEPIDLGYARDAVAVTRRCEEASLLLRQLIDLNVPNEKLRLLVRVAKEICDTPDVNGPPTKSISADDLIPLLSYACIQSSKQQLMTECFLLEALTNQKNLMGEEGYCLTSLHTSLQYITSLPDAGKGLPEITIPHPFLESTV